jgi:hypothetical protein
VQCLVCKFENPGTATFCKKCGKQLDFTAEEIREGLIAREKEERKKGMEHYARQLTVAAAAFFLLMITLFIVAGGAPREAHVVPPAAERARFLAVVRPLEEVLGVKGPHELLPIVDFPLQGP